MTKEEAKKAYRAAWAQYLLTQDLSRKRELERVMDACQSKITRGPGPEWSAFAETLPGFLKFWDAWYQKAKGQYEDKFGEKWPEEGGDVSP